MYVNIKYNTGNLIVQQYPSLRVLQLTNFSGYEEEIK